MGQLIMLGTLLGLVGLIFGLVWTFDPEARRRTDAGEGPARPDRDSGANP